MNDTDPSARYPALEFLRRHIENPGTPNPTRLKYPTAISTTLKFQVTSVDLQRAVVTVEADADVHGNQQGTVHGGLICELADAAIGTAQSTVTQDGQSFTTVELKVNFIRPTWRTRLRAEAYPIHSGRTVMHYRCDITNAEGKLVAFAISTVMVLSGSRAHGR